MSIKNIVACAAIAACSFAAQAQNIVVNGSFEQVSGSNTQNAGSWGIYSSITGWTGTPNIEVRDSVAGNAQHGSNYVELDTYNNSGMFQTITGNGWYELSFCIRHAKAWLLVLTDWASRLETCPVKFWPMWQALHLAMSGNSTQASFS